MKLISCFFEDISGLKVIFTIVTFSALVKENEWNFLVVTLGLHHSDIVKYLFTLETKIIANGNQ
jgi:hypothetical protein